MATATITEAPPAAEAAPLLEVQFLAQHGIGVLPGVAVHAIARGTALQAMRDRQAGEFAFRTAVDNSGREQVYALPEVEALAAAKLKHRAAADELTAAQGHARQQQSALTDAIRAGGDLTKLEAAVRDADARVASLQHRVDVLAEAVTTARAAAKKESLFVGRRWLADMKAAAEANLRAAEMAVQDAISEPAVLWLLARERHALVSSLTADYPIE